MRKQNILILQTPRVPEKGHRILVSSSGDKIFDDIDHMCADAQRGQKPDSYLRIARKVYQGPEFGNREGEEALTLAGPIVRDAFKKKKIHEIEASLQRLWNKVDGIFNKDLPWEKTVFITNELDDWLKSILDEYTHNQTKKRSKFYSLLLIISLVSLMSTFFILQKIYKTTYGEQLDGSHIPVNNETNKKKSEKNNQILAPNKGIKYRYGNTIIKECRYSKEEAILAEKELHNIDPSLLEKWQFGFSAPRMRETAFLKLSSGKSLEELAELKRFIPKEKGLQTYCQINKHLDEIGFALFLIQKKYDEKSNKGALLHKLLKHIKAFPIVKIDKSKSPIFSDSDYTSFSFYSQMKGLKKENDQLLEDLEKWLIQTIKDDTKESSLNNQYAVIASLHLLMRALENLDRFNANSQI